MKTKEIERILGKAVLSNLQVNSVLSSYSISELMNLDTDSLNAIYKILAKKLDAYNTNSLEENKESRQINNINRQMEVVKAMHTFKKDRATELANAAKVRKEKRERLALLQNAKSTKELEAIKELSLADLEKEIADLSV